MILNISDCKLTVIESGIYHFELSDYPRIKEYELNKMVTFIRYEKSHGRQTEIICEDANILAIVDNAVVHPEKNTLSQPENELVYHGTNIDATQKILSGGRLLSATRVYGKTGEEFAFDRSNTRWNDPADYFEYIMFCWGDNPTGDYVVLSEKFPSEEDLKNGDFNPGVRFYFRYEDIIHHPGQTFDGYHAIKIKDEILLSEYLFACIVPEQYKIKLVNYTLPELTSKVFYLSQDSLGLSEWNDKVYNFVKKL